MYNYRKEELGVCSATVETPFGSRIAILGYRPWDYVGLPGKSVVFAVSFLSGEHAACSYNASEDKIESPLFQGIAKNQPVDVLYPDSAPQRITSSSIGEITLPDLPSWGECLVKWGNEPV
ncbi:hypothetical protein BH09VER1_BH09VER1_53590 [soil metagenome]